MIKEKLRKSLKKFIKLIKIILSDKQYRMIFGGVLLGIFLLIVVIAVLSSSNKNEMLKGIFDSNKPIVINKDGKYGYITADGKELIEAKYISAGDFYFDYAYVSTVNDKNETVYQIIDKTGTSLMEISSATEPKYIDETAVWLIDSNIYNKDMKLIYDEESYVTYVDYGFFSYMSNDGKESGILNSEGKKVFSWEEDYITADISISYHKEEGYYAVLSNYEENEIIVNLNSGKTVFTLEDPKNQYIQVEDNNVFRIIDRSDSYKTVKWMYFKDNEMVFSLNESIYQIELVNYENQILRFNYGADFQKENKSSRYAYYNIEKGEFLEENSENVSKITEASELMRVKYNYQASSCEGGLKKVIFKKKDVTPCEYASVHFINMDLYEYVSDEKNRELVLLEKEDTTVLYDLNDKKEIKTFNSTSVSDDSRSTFLNSTLYEENGYTKKGYLIHNILTGKEMEFEKNATVELNSNYIKVSINEKTTYYNTKLEKIYEE